MTDPRFTARAVPSKWALVAAALLALALGAGCNEDATFCESMCDELVACNLRISFDECVTACEDELDVAFDVGGDACVAAREDYLDCAPIQQCDGSSPEFVQCIEDAVDGEIAACGEALGEF